MKKVISETGYIISFDRELKPKKESGVVTRMYYVLDSDSYSEDFSFECLIGRDERATVALGRELLKDVRNSNPEVERITIKHKEIVTDISW